MSQDSGRLGLTSWVRGEVEAGGWVRASAAQAQRLRERYGPDAVADLSLGQPLEATEAVRSAFEAATRVVRRLRFAYMPNLGYPELRERIAEDVDFPGVTAQSVVLTVGAAGAISMALRALVEPGREVVVVAPYFSEYRLYSAVSGHGLRIVPPTRDGSLDLDGLAKALNGTTGAVILNSPGNPNGHVLTDHELSGVGALLEEHRRRRGRRVLLVVDEVYRRIIHPPHRRADPFVHHPDTVLCRSFSKDLGLAGERIGYLALHPSLSSPEAEAGLALCQRALGYVNAPATAQLALLELPSWECDPIPYRERRDLIAAGAGSAGLATTECQGGFYLWVRSPWADCMAFCAALAERRTVVVPGVAFGAPDWFRICFSAEMGALEIAAAALAATAAASPG
ncbi:MAG TPA: aminotransferase class I/II-fold pyridoxal phosphate-dependent enzyme [Candidatus Binatia bacterium]|nr:aminotransferase class I/II-fold pyridoxal phosphate-dependent enzyme [Candidatus Binatia bacterium]